MISFIESSLIKSRFKSFSFLLKKYSAGTCPYLLRTPVLDAD